jgi:hypothetical protein
VEQQAAYASAESRRCRKSAAGCNDSACIFCMTVWKLLLTLLFAYLPHKLLTEYVHASEVAVHLSAHQATVTCYFYYMYRHQPGTAHCMIQLHYTIQTRLFTYLVFTRHLPLDRRILQRGNPQECS